MSTCYIESEARARRGPVLRRPCREPLDKRSGREWMTQGGRSANTGEDARYGGDEAVGWTSASHRRLLGRDRTAGAVPCATMATSGAVPGRWTPPDRTPSPRPMAVPNSPSPARCASLAGAHGPLRREQCWERAASYLWALTRCSRRAGRRHRAAGHRARARHLSVASGPSAGGGRDGLVGGQRRPPFRLAEVQPPSSVFAGKFLVSACGRRARLGRSGQWLEIAWDAHVDGLGIWLTYGAWPQPGGHQEAALEPTSAAADHLGEAIAAGSPPLAPGERREWSVTLAVAS